MSKDYIHLDWEQLKQKLFPYLKTEKGKKNLKNLEPIFDLREAKLFKEKSYFIWHQIERGEKLELPSLPSLEEILQRASKRGFFLVKEISSLALWIETAYSLKKILDNSLFSEIKNYLPELERLLQKIKDIFDLNHGEVRSKASYQLFLIRKKRRELEEELISKIERLKEFYWKKGYLQENIYLQKEGRYVLPVKPEFKNKVRGVFRGLSQSGSTVFIEPLSIIELTNELEEILWREEKEILRILKEVSGEILPLEEEIKRVEEIIADLDLTIAKVLIGRIYRGVFPEIVREGELLLEEAFHPLLFFRSIEKGTPLPVKNNYYLKKALLITGPNLGGKTVTLKTIGISVIMALNGFLIPAKRAVIPFFSEILMDLGDEQDLWEGESSFSSHLKNLKRILEQSSNQTLVLLDEPGRGTNPEEGAALIWAIIEKLLDKGAKVVLTTHSRLLKSFSSMRPEFQYAKVDFDKKNFVPTYKLVYGYFGDSHAFDLAHKIGLEEEILNRAKNFLQNKKFYELEEKYAKEIATLEKLKKELEEKLNELERERQSFLEEKEKFKNRINEEVRIWQKKWQEEFQKFLASLPKEVSRKKTLEKFQKFMEKNTPSTLQEDFKEGDKVYVRCFNREGIILKLRDKKAEILSGNIKFEVPITELKFTTQKPSFYEISRKREILGEGESFQNSKETLNLLGEDVESAINLLERKINDCFMKGKSILLVIHGHGTGRLRFSVREYLKGHPLVEGIEEASPEEGGSGATKVFLVRKR